MARNTSKSKRLGIQDDQRVFSSPIALAFVRTVVARRGITEAQARLIYRNYLNRSLSDGKPSHRAPE